ncbi:conserved hypothetical protein [Escherichia coli]|nr:hypothetical protein SD22575_4087 [Shigella dysenteriae 225-75]KDX24010.1 hypothetical protein AC96_3671 [Escherichia coli 2-156-04_S4_C2]SOQ60114.1 conserved hypothetical protein [Escherichia coli]SOQ67332.1 conserved hypothetical protein [Escherichia coli]SOQ72880.1 conserved hypothetical protein [Escherichia coli]
MQPHLIKQLSLVFEVPVDSATRNVSGVGNVVERRLAYAMLRKLGDGSFNQFLPGLQSFGFGSFCHD